MTLPRLETRVPAGRDVPIAASDSFCFSLLDSVPSSRRRHCSTVNTFASPRSKVRRNARIVSSPPSFIIICLP